MTKNTRAFRRALSKAGIDFGICSGAKLRENLLRVKRARDKEPSVAAPREGKKDSQVATSLGKIAEALARASGDPIVGQMSGSQVIWMIANIIRVEAQRVKGKE